MKRINFSHIKNILLKKYLKYILIALLISGIFFLVGFIRKYHIPKIKNWVLIEIEDFSQKNTQIRVWPKNIEISFIPMGIVISDIQLKPQNELAQYMAPGQIQSIEAHLSFLSLLQGKLKLSEIIINEPQLHIFIDDKTTNKKTSSQKNKNLNWVEKKNDLFNQLNKIPIENIIIKKIKFYSLLKKQKYALHSDDLSLEFNLQKNNLVAQIISPSLKVKQTDKINLFSIFINTKISISRNQIDISNMHLMHHESELKGSGYIKFSESDLKPTDIKSNLSLKADISSLYKKFTSFFPNKPLPKLTGHLKTEISYQKFQNKNSSSQFKLNTKNINIDNFVLGDLTSKGQLLNNSLQLTQLSILNNSGQLELHDTKFQIIDNFNFETQIHVSALELRQLLMNLNVPPTPLHLDITGKLPCKGALKPKFFLKCSDSELFAKNFIVHSGPPEKFLITGFEQMKINGGVTVDSSKVTYSALLESKNSKGSSKGVIDYQKGFNIKYQSPTFNIQDLTTLAGLKFEGTTSIKGSTYGTSDYGIIKMNIKTNNLWFEDYFLNNIQSQVEYKKGQLKFNNILGKYMTTQYNGRVGINLIDSQIFIKAHSPFLDGEEISNIFEKKVTLPFTLSGTGTAYAKVWGPLQFNKLNYNFKTNLFRGSISGESFDEFQAEFNSNKGHVKSGNTYLKKGQGQFKLTGTANPDGNIKSKITGYNLKLEEFEFLSDLNLNLSGNFNFKTNLTGYILDPEIISKGQFVNITMNNDPIPSSQFDLDINSNAIKVNADFMKGTLVTSLNWPFNENQPFHFYLKTKKWNFTRFVSLFADQSERKKYTASVDSVIDLRSEKGGFWASSGEAKISKFYIKRPPYSMKNMEPLKINFNKGIINTENFYIEGDSSSKLEFIANNMTKNNFNAKFQGSFPLSLATILTPVAELTGQANTLVQLKGSYAHPRLEGQLGIKNGLVKVKEFPHYFENLTSNIRFNTKQLKLILLQGNLAQGPFSAQGTIDFHEIQNVPINITGKFNNVKLNVPENINTNGFGNVSLTGQWFPYLLNINYDVQSGQITKEFDENNDSNTFIKPSQLLPQFLIKENFSPIELNINAKLTNPIPIKNSQVDAKIMGNLSIKGDPEAPLLEGTINTFSDGKIYFRDNEFEILNASLNYKQAPPQNPNILLASKTQIQTEDLTYDIQLRVQGSANDPKINLTSIPPLKEYEIISLLALGMTQQELDEKVNAEELAAQTSYQLGSALLSSPLGKQIKNRFGFDFRISSEFDKDDSAVPKVTIKKQLTQKLDATASRTLDQNPKNNVQLKYKVNKNLSVIGIWDGSENKDSTGVQSDASNSVIGIDLEYKRKFK